MCVLLINSPGVLAGRHPKGWQTRRTDAVRQFAKFARGGAANWRTIEFQQHTLVSSGTSSPPNSVRHQSRRRAETGELNSMSGAQGHPGWQREPR
jgi:hypothetical protein